MYKELTTSYWEYKVSWNVEVDMFKIKNKKEKRKPFVSNFFLFKNFVLFLHLKDTWRSFFIYLIHLKFRSCFIFSKNNKAV